MLDKQYKMDQKCNEGNNKKPLLQNKAKRVHYQGKNQKILHNRLPSME